LARLVYRRQWSEIFPITPTTILRWHRDLVSRTWTYTDRRRPGRPGTRRPVTSDIQRLVVDLGVDRKKVHLSCKDLSV
jgi:hypothetical protein